MIVAQQERYFVIDIILIKEDFHLMNTTESTESTEWKANADIVL